MLSRRMHAALGLMAALYVGTTFTLAWLRFENVHQRTYDLALYARAAYGLAHGDAWLPILNTHVLAAHVAPVLLPLGLLGRLFGTVPVLLMVQSLAAALCLWPLARIGARRMGVRGVWLGVSAWCLYPNLDHVLTYEFHPGTLAVLPLCWAYDALDARSFKGLALSCAGILLCRDDFGMACVLLALLYALEHRDRRAKWLAVATLAYTTFAVALSLHYAPEDDSLSQHFGVWGGSPLGVVRVLFTDPGVVWDHFTQKTRLLYLPRLFAPFAFLALGKVRLLLPAAPYLALNMLSEFPTSLEQYSHYLTPAVPGLVVAGLVGVTEVRARGVHALCLGALIISNVALGGLPWSRAFEHEAFRKDAQTEAGRAVLAQIPEGRSVQAPDALLPHLIERKVVRRGPPPEAGTDFVVLDISHRQRFAHTETLLRTSEEPFVRWWFSRDDHALLVYAPPYALFERGRPPRSSPLWAHYLVADGEPQGREQRLSACLSVLGAEVQKNPAGAHELVLSVRAHGPCPSDLAVRFGPESEPLRVDLLFDGALSPAHLRDGDVLISTHALDDALYEKVRERALWVGVLRSSGARPEPSDPFSVRVKLPNTSLER